MPVVVGGGSGEFPATIQHVSNGEPANETTMRRPSIDLENRTLALKTFTEDQEDLRDAQLGTSDSVIEGVQGTFNTTHTHNGTGSSTIDFQQIYDNDADVNSVVQMAAGGSIEFKNSGGSSILKIDEATSKFIGATIIGSSEIDWGTGADKVSAESIPDGATKTIVTLTQESNWDTHLSANVETGHGGNFKGFPFQPTNVSATGASTDVSTEMSGQTPGGSGSVEGIVTNVAYNRVILKDTALDDFVDGSGNKVYGRITEASGTWTLTYYSNVAGVETSYTGFSGTNVQWWVQKTYAFANAPIYNSMFYVPSDQVASVVDLTNIATDVTPASDDSNDLGGTSNRWQNIWMGSGELNISTGKLRYSGGKVQVSHNGTDFNDISSGSGVPSGSIIDFGGSSAPAGWLMCDGTAVSRATYDALYAAIGVTFGIGDGATTFNLPDFMGRTSVGVGSGAGLTARSLADSSGTESHTHTVASHNHQWFCSCRYVSGNWNQRQFSFNSAGSQTVLLATGDLPAACSAGSQGITGTYPISSTTSSKYPYLSGCNQCTTRIYTANATPSTDSQSHMPPFVAVNKIIKV